MPNRMLTEQEVAAILKTTPRAVRRLDGLRRLYLKPTKRREVRYSETDVQNYIKEMSTWPSASVRGRPTTSMSSGTAASDTEAAPGKRIKGRRKKSNDKSARKSK